MLAHDADDERLRPFQTAHVLSFVHRVHRAGHVEYERDFFVRRGWGFQIYGNRRKRHGESCESKREERSFEFADIRTDAVVSGGARKLSIPENSVRQKGERPNGGRREYEDETGGRHYTEGSSLAVLDVATNRRRETRSTTKNGNCAEEYRLTVSRTDSFFVEASSASKTFSKPFTSLALAKVHEVVVEMKAMSSASTIARMGFPSGQRK